MGMGKRDSKLPSSYDILRPLQNISFFHLDTPWFMFKAPRILQSVFSAIDDLYLFKISYALFGGSVAKWALFSQLTNWFIFFCINRTFSNSLELFSHLWAFTIGLV